MSLSKNKVVYSDVYILLQPHIWNNNDHDMKNNIITNMFCKNNGTEKYPFVNYAK